VIAEQVEIYKDIPIWRAIEDHFEYVGTYTSRVRSGEYYAALEESGSWMTELTNRQHRHLVSAGDLSTLKHLIDVG
jgi:hypothetical protein